MKNYFLAGIVCIATFNAVYPEDCCDFDFDLDFNAAVLILKPGSSNMHYAVEAVPAQIISPQWNIFDIHPGYSAAFDIGFCLTKNNFFLSVDWERFHSRSTNRFSTEAASSGPFFSPEGMVGPFFEIGADATPYKNASGLVRFNFNQINIQFGRNFFCNDCFQTRIFGGIGIALLKQKLIATYSDTTGTIVRTITTPVQFTGAGPQFGFDFSYNIWGDLSLNGHGLCTLLTSQLKNNTQFSSASPTLATLDFSSPNLQSVSARKRTDLIPAFQKQIGLSYYIDYDCLQAELEVGYQAQIYLNALQSTDIGSEIALAPATPNTVGVYARTFQRNVSHFWLAGPYIAVSFGF